MHNQFWIVKSSQNKWFVNQKCFKPVKAPPRSYNIKYHLGVGLEPNTALGFVQHSALPCTVLVSRPHALVLLFPYCTRSGTLTIKYGTGINQQKSKIHCMSKPQPLTSLKLLRLNSISIALQKRMVMSKLNNRKKYNIKQTMKHTNHTTIYKDIPHALLPNIPVIRIARKISCKHILCHFNLVQLHCNICTPKGTRAPSKVPRAHKHCNVHMGSSLWQLWVQYMPKLASPVCKTNAKSVWRVLYPVKYEPDKCFF